jgi:hypothetical protein
MVIRAIAITAIVALLAGCSTNLSPPFPVFEADEGEVQKIEYCEQRLECETRSRLDVRVCYCSPN